MAELGYFISCEETAPRQAVRFAQMAEDAGFESVLVSDHFHPWIERQGESPFVWAVIGGIAAATNLRVTTGVTCPTMRIHPAIVAQAAATASLMLEGRFALGVGSGEALNEHILGQSWPAASVRLEMLEEAVSLIRQLWQGGFVTHHGVHFTAENARIYSCPEESPPIYVSGFGPRAVELAAAIGDGYVNVTPESSAIDSFRSAGGKGPTLGAVKVCWGEDEDAARKLAFDVWKTSGVTGELNQELPLPRHFEQAATHVTEDMIAGEIPCGPDPARHAEVIKRYIDAGYDQVYVNQIGDDLAGFLQFFNNDVRPLLG